MPKKDMRSKLIQLIEYNAFKLIDDKDLNQLKTDLDKILSTNSDSNNLIKVYKIAASTSSLEDIKQKIEKIEITSKERKYLESYPSYRLLSKSKLDEFKRTINECKSYKKVRDTLITRVNEDKEIAYLILEPENKDFLCFILKSKFSGIYARYASESDVVSKLIESGSFDQVKFEDQKVNLKVNQNIESHMKELQAQDNAMILEIVKTLSEIVGKYESDTIHKDFDIEVSKQKTGNLSTLHKTYEELYFLKSLKNIKEKCNQLGVHEGAIYNQYHILEKLGLLYDAVISKMEKGNLYQKDITLLGPEFKQLCLNLGKIGKGENYKINELAVTNIHEITKEYFIEQAKNEIRHIKTSLSSYNFNCKNDQLAAIYQFMRIGELYCKIKKFGVNDDVGTLYKNFRDYLNHNGSCNQKIILERPKELSLNTFLDQVVNHNKENLLKDFRSMIEKLALPQKETSTVDKILFNLENIISCINLMNEFIKNIQPEDDLENELEKDSHHKYFLYLITVIGNAIQDIRYKPEIISLIDYNLLTRLEYLKWIRNSLMHYDRERQKNSKVEDLSSDIEDIKEISHCTNKLVSYIIFLNEIHPSLNKLASELKKQTSYSSSYTGVDLKINKEQIKKRKREDNDLNKKHRMKLNREFCEDNTIPNLLNLEEKIKAAATDNNVIIEGLFGDIIKLSVAEYDMTTGIYVSECMADDIQQRKTNLMGFKEDLRKLELNIKVATKSDLTRYPGNLETATFQEIRNNQKLHDIVDKNNFLELFGFEHNYTYFGLIPQNKERKSAKAIHEHDIFFELKCRSIKPVLHKIFELALEQDIWFAIFSRLLANYNGNVLDTFTQENLLHIIACSNKISTHHIDEIFGKLTNENFLQEDKYSTIPLTYALSHQEINPIAYKLFNDNNYTLYKDHIGQILSAAIDYCHEDFVKIIIDKFDKFVENPKSIDGKPALNYVIYPSIKFFNIGTFSNYDLVKQMIDKGASFQNYRNKETPLFYFILENFAELAKMTLKNFDGIHDMILPQASVKQQKDISSKLNYKKQYHAIHIAIIRYSIMRDKKWFDVIVEIADKITGFNIELNYSEETPIYLAAKHHLEDVVIMLVDKGANIQHKEHRFKYIDMDLRARKIMIASGFIEDRRTKIDNLIKALNSNESLLKCELNKSLKMDRDDVRKIGTKISAENTLFLLSNNIFDFNDLRIIIIRNMTYSFIINNKINALRMLSSHVRIEIPKIKDLPPQVGHEVMLFIKKHIDLKKDLKKSDFKISKETLSDVNIGFITLELLEIIYKNNRALALKSIIEIYGSDAIPESDRTTSALKYESNNDVIDVLIDTYGKEFFLDEEFLDNKSILEKALLLGFDPNVNDKHGYNAIHRCIINRSLESLKLLLRYNQDRSVTNFIIFMTSGRQTPVDLALDLEDNEYGFNVAKILVEGSSSPKGNLIKLILYAIKNQDENFYLSLLRTCVQTTKEEISRFSLIFESIFPKKISTEAIKFWHEKVRNDLFLPRVLKEYLEPKFFDPKQLTNALGSMQILSEPEDSDEMQLGL